MTASSLPPGSPAPPVATDQVCVDGRAAESPSRPDGTVPAELSRIEELERALAAAERRASEAEERARRAEGAREMLAAAFARLAAAAEPHLEGRSERVGGSDGRSASGDDAGGDFFLTQLDAVRERLAALWSAARSSADQRVLLTAVLGDITDSIDELQVAAEILRRREGPSEDPILTARSARKQARALARTPGRHGLEGALAEAENLLGFLSEAKYRALVEQIPAITYVAALDPVGTILYLSPQAHDLLGMEWTGSLVLADVWRERIHPEDKERVLSERRRSQETGQPLDVEYRMATADGQTRWFRDAAVVVRGEAGQPLFLQGVMLDITERKQAEEERERLLAENRRQREFLEMLLENATIGIAVVRGSEHRCVLANSAFQAIPGVPEASPVGRPIAEALPGIVAKGALPLLDQVYTTGETVSLREYEAPHGPGREHTHWHIDLVPMRNPEGVVDSVLILARDITRDVVARQRLRFLSEASSILSASLDYATTLSAVARVAVRTLADWCVVDVVEEDGSVARLAAAHADPDREALVRSLKRYPPDPRKMVGVPQVLRTGKPVLIPEHTKEQAAGVARNARHLRVLNQLGHRSIISVPLCSRGRTLGAITLVLSESGRRYSSADLALAEELGRRAAVAVENARLYQGIQRAEARYRTLVETSPDAVALTDVRGNILMVNQQTATLYGCQTTQEMTGRNIVDLLAPEERPRAVYHLRRAMQTGLLRDVEVTFLRRDGTLLPAALSVSRIVDEQGRPTGFIGVVRDITERKRAEEALRKQQREIATLHAITAAVSTSLELQEVLNTLRRLLAEELEAPGGAIFLANEEGSLELRACWGLTEPAAAGLAAMPASAFPWDDVTRRREPVLVPDLAECGAAGGEVSALPGRACLYVPLVAKGEAQGMVALLARSAEAFGDPRGGFFAALGQEAGVAIENARLFEQVRAAHERLEALSQRLVEIQETERRHIARELHDEIGQSLTGLKLMLEMSHLVGPGERAATLQEAQALLAELMAQVRELSLRLRPPILDDLGLVPALLWHLERYTPQTRVHVTLKHTRIEGRLAPEVETAAYRIVQEALTNVARHSRASEAVVRLWTGQGILGVQIEDAGVGFNPESVLPGGKASGLAGMRERARLLGGELTIESSPGAGTRITAEIPLRKSDGRSGHPHEHHDDCSGG